MRRLTEELEEIAIRQAPEDLLPLLETFTQPAAARSVVRRWLAVHGQADGGLLLRQLSGRQRALAAIADEVFGTHGVVLDKYVGCCGIRKLISKGDIEITPYVEQNVRVDSIDLTQGATRWVRRRGRRGSLRPSTTKAIRTDDLFEPVPVTTDRPLFLPPRASAIAETLETVRLSSRVGLRVDNLSTQARLLLRVVLAEHIHAGSRGPIMLEYVNEGDDEIVIFPGDPVAQAFVFMVSDNHAGYGDNLLPMPNGSATATCRPL